MAGKKEKGMAQRVWDFIISVKLTIVLLIILSCVCVIGTLIPQNESPQHYLQLYSQSTYRLFASLGFLNLFASWWFFWLMTFFTVNLTACSLNRLPRVWRAIFHGDTVLDDKLLQGLSNVRKFTLKKFSTEQLAQYEAAIARYLARPARLQNPGGWNLFSESGRYTRFGFYLTHLGLIIIIFGSMSGSLGFQGYMQIAESQTSQIMQLKNSNEIKKLDFAIRCDRTDYKVHAVEFLPDFSMDASGNPFSRSSEFNNPAVRLAVVKGKAEEYSKWVFAKFPDFHGKGDQPLGLQLVNFQPRYYTGLQVTYDPGVLVVWLGCILLTGGIYVAFFTSHRRIWLRVEEKDGDFKAVLAGSTNKNHAAFSREFETLFKSLKA